MFIVYKGLKALYFKQSMERVGKLRLKRLFLYWLPVFLFAGLIFYLSSMPGSELLELPGVPEIEFLPTVGHVVEYAILSFLLFRVVANAESSALRVNAYFFAIFFAILFGVTDELHQFFVSGRDCSGVDLFFDGVGSCLILVQRFFKR